MFGYDSTVFVFSLGAFAVWGYALFWAFTRPKEQYPWYHMWVLGLVTLFWFVGESLARRLGKYSCPLDKWPETLRASIPRTWFGTAAAPYTVEKFLFSLVPSAEGPPWRFDTSCVAQTYTVPLPVVAFEAALVFGFFHLATVLLRTDKGRLRTALATGGLCGLLMVNAF